MLSWSLLGLTVLAAVGLAVLGLRLKRDLPIFQNALILGAIAVVIWVPRVWSDAILSLLLALAITFVPDRWLSKIITFVVGGGLSFLVMSVFPGGGATLCLLIVLLVAFIEGRSGLRHLLMLRRARRLDPRNDISQKSAVAIGGRAIGPVIETSLPEIPSGRYVAFQLQTVLGEVLHAEPDLLVAESDAGEVGIDLWKAKLQCSETRSISGKEGAALAAALKTPTKEEVLVLHGLAPGAEFYVVGAPAWQQVSSGRGYRDSPRIPVFRTTDSIKAIVLDTPGKEAHARAWWALARWVVWGIVSAAVVAGQWLRGMITLPP
jgi:hypothetical protein